MTSVRLARRGLTQVLVCADLLTEADRIRLELPARVDAVYSDPPWTPGNEKYWRRHAGVGDGRGYAAFLAAWHAVTAMCVQRGAEHVLVEQSENAGHRQAFLDARAGWNLPQSKEWIVAYGRPSRPNRLLHFSWRALTADPSGMSGQEMTLRACVGLHLPPGATIVDPCMGRGMTSRIAHILGWQFFGVELNPRRLAVASTWLRRQGYEDIA